MLKIDRQAVYTFKHDMTSYIIRVTFELIMLQEWGLREIYLLDLKAISEVGFSPRSSRPD